jgi:hypothetical protein
LSLAREFENITVGPEVREEIEELTANALIPTKDNQEEAAEKISDLRQCNTGRIPLSRFKLGIDQQPGHEADTQ